MTDDVHDMHSDHDRERIVIATRELVYHVDEAVTAIGVADRELELLTGPNLYDIELVEGAAADMRHDFEVAKRALRNIRRATQLRRTLLDDQQPGLTSGNPPDDDPHTV